MTRAAARLHLLTATTTMTTARRCTTASMLLLLRRLTTAGIGMPLLITILLWFLVRNFTRLVFAEAASDAGRLRLQACDKQPMTNRTSENENILCT